MRGWTVKSNENHLPPTGSQLTAMSAVREEFNILADVIVSIIPEGRYRSLALKALEESAMWACKAITRHDVQIDDE